MEALVIGAGLAGCEAAWQLANRGIRVRLVDMKPAKLTPAHHMAEFAELVCSNSLKAEKPDSAPGLLKAEMRRLNSIIMECAYRTRVPAGGALAVDREAFAREVTEAVRAHPNIEIVSQEVTAVPDAPCVIATGPLTADALASDIAEKLGQGNLSFYDASAPLIAADSIDMEKAFFASRYGGGGDYINCPMNRDEYMAFYSALVSAETVPLRETETPKLFEGCMPVEAMAKRGEMTLAFGMLKPVGLRDPKTGKRPFAVVQLRRDNAEGTVYNMVGFQTNLRFGEQKRVFSMIPGLERAEILRYGVMHRNTFINSPKLLDASYRVKGADALYFAGQITGVEGYVESAASGLCAGIALGRRLKGLPVPVFPKETMLGALGGYISGYVGDFQPMNANLGILPQLAEGARDKRVKKERLVQRALCALDEAIKEQGLLQDWEAFDI